MTAVASGSVRRDASGEVTHIVAIDVGGTHARFALAELQNGKVASVGQETVLKTGDFPGIRQAWLAYGHIIGRPLPSAAALAVAARVDEKVVRFTNNHWIIRPETLSDELTLDSHVLLNDFAAVAHSIAQLGDVHFTHVCGPDGPLPPTGTISVMGPGTGLGVAMLIHHADGYTVRATEGGHISFAPTDGLEEALLARLRARFGRVSIERVVSGPGLAEFYDLLRYAEGHAENPVTDAELWSLALSGHDRLALNALDRFLAALGAVSGDVALAQGADAVVIAGGLGYRMRSSLARSPFAKGFVDKGRFASTMTNIPVKLILHPQPGLLGAAAAYAKAHQ